MSAPTDPLFYVDLDAMAQRVGAKSEDLLLVWSSESDLRSDLTGSARTFSTIIHPIAVPKNMTEEIWDNLPSMSARQQLPYVEKIVYAPAHRALGRAFRDTFETYLANAAPGLLRAGGDYSGDSVMYAGANYPDNWPMDNTPAPSIEAQKAGVTITSPRDTYDFCKTLVASGVLKGYVSLGDLEVFAKRVLASKARSGSTFATAMTYLHHVRDNVSRGLAPSIDPVPSEMLLWQPVTYDPLNDYEPHFDGFSKNAPIDARVATPTKARTMMPSEAGGSSPRALSVGAIGVGAGIALVLGLIAARRG